MVIKASKGLFWRRTPSRRCLIHWLIATVVMVWGCGGGGGGEPAASIPTTVTLSGTISAPDGVIIDSDVNDPNEAYIANDAVATAQPLANPVSVGGYVNVPATGASGRSYTIGDRDDFFRVPLNAGDKISLAIGDSDAADLDLYLYDTAGNHIADSLGDDKYETITAPADGIYVVNVYAYAGASNYILAVGADIDDRPADILSTRYDFVTGQAIVRFKDTGMATAASTDRAAALGMRLAAGGGDREALLTFDGTDTQSESYLALGVTKRLSSGKAATGTATADKLDTLGVIKALRKRADVLSADPNYILQPYATAPDDEYYYLQWHYPQISLPQAWDLTTGSSSVVVAVVDTGVLLNHPDLAGQIADSGYDFISDASISNDGDGIDPDPNDPGDSATVGSSSFHGTHCAGTVAASTDNAIGLAGVSWRTRIMPIRVLGVGGGTSYDILQGVRYAAGLSNDSGTVPAQRADIISMSLGGGGYSSADQAVYDQVRDAGVILIAAAGNESTSTPSYPAAYEGVVSVSAVTINGTLASYSNYGSHVDVAAPGGDSGDYNGDGYADLVWSTCGDDSSGSIQYTYEAKAGTSMATPHVAGVVALMKSLDPTMTPDGLDAMLQHGDITNDIGDAGRDEFYGYGLIDAYKAVVAAGNGSVPTVLTVYPTSVNLGTSATSATLTVSMIGSDPISVAGFSDAPESWMAVGEASVDANGFGTYTVTADRSGLADGTYSTSVTFTASSGSSVSIPVNLQVRTVSTSADAGFHYVLLVDPDTSEVIQQDDVEAVDGSYAYSFSGVTAGESYLIVAGSDRDNDRYIDNPGEALGAYISLDQITHVDADSDLSGLDFATDLKLSVSVSNLSADDPDGRRGQRMRLR